MRWTAKYAKYANGLVSKPGTAPFYKTRGRQLSIKDISSVTAEPTRGWDEKEPTTKIVFA
jgi:hypothetical protein